MVFVRAKTDPKLETSTKSIKHNPSSTIYSIHNRGLLVT